MDRQEFINRYMYPLDSTEEVVLLEGGELEKFVANCSRFGLEGYRGKTAIGPENMSVRSLVRVVKADGYIANPHEVLAGPYVISGEAGPISYDGVMLYRQLNDRRSNQRNL